jgi:hypothetical protein
MLKKRDQTEKQDMCQRCRSRRDKQYIALVAIGVQSTTATCSLRKWERKTECHVDRVSPRCIQHRAQFSVQQASIICLEVWRPKRSFAASRAPPPEEVCIAPVVAAVLLLLLFCDSPLCTSFFLSLFQSTVGHQFREASGAMLCETAKKRYLFASSLMSCFCVCIHRVMYVGNS